MRTVVTRLTAPLALAGILAGAGHVFAAGASPAEAFLDAGRFNTERSVTGGIQEAIDSLPKEGGTVRIPPGIHVLHRPVVLKPRTRLVGAGRGTVLKKDAALLVKLTADAQKDQDSVVVEDASKIRVGACVVVGDRSFHPSINHAMAVTRIEGKRVFLKNILNDNARLGYDVAVDRGACLMNLFVVIKPAVDCVVTDMELDGNAREQMTDYVTKSDVFTGYGMLWAGLYPADGITVERCWVHDCGIGIHINAFNGVVVRNCEVYRNTADGIHCGGGPHSFLHNNRIYENGAAGVSFCYGNRKLIITDNEIMRNLAGIYCMGNGERQRDSTADRYTIVSQNIIYENKRAGLASGQGDIGPQDFVFTGNILQNNQQQHWRRPEAPAGIAFVNPQRCVIANNRCFDDRATYPRLVLDKPAKAGDSVVSVAQADRNITKEPFAGKDDWIRIKDGPNTAVYTVLGVKNWDIRLSAPLVKSHAAGTPVVRLGSQKWGIAILGTEAVHNVISGNVCVGNASGGILVERRDTNVFSGNVGTIVDYDVGKLPLENLFPSLQKVAMPNGDFEGTTGWVLPPGKAEYDNVTHHAGKRALKLTRADDKGVVDADYPLSLEPNCRYRLTVFLRSSALKAERARFPAVMAIGRSGTALGPYANPGGYAPDPEWTGGAKWEARKWMQFGCEFQTGPDDTEIVIKCRAWDGVGESWVDDVAVDLVDRLAE